MFDDDDKIQEALDGTLFFVQATHFEQQCLWLENFDREKWIKSWSGNRICYPLEISKKLFVGVEFANLDGQWVCFYYPQGNIVNWEQTNKWRDKVTKNKKWDKKSLMGDGVTYGRPAYCDPWNFHHCLEAIEEANNKTE